MPDYESRWKQALDLARDIHDTWPWWHLGLRVMGFSTELDATMKFVTIEFRVQDGRGMVADLTSRCALPDRLRNPEDYVFIRNQVSRCLSMTIREKFSSPLPARVS